MRVLFLLTFIILSLSGCEVLSDLRAKILNRGTTAVETVKDKAQTINDQYTKTKDSVTERIDEVRQATREVQEAATQVKQAVDAIDKIGVDESKNKNGTAETATAPTGAGTETEESNGPSRRVPNLEDAEIQN